MSKIGSTFSQCRELLKRPVGSGFIVWRSADNSTSECEVFIKDGVVHNSHNGKPLSFQFGAEGTMKARQRERS